MRTSAIGQDPLLEHPLAPTPSDDAEPTLRVAYRPSLPTTPIIRSPLPSVRSPRSVLRLEDDEYAANRTPRLPPTIIPTSPGIDDPLSRALRSIPRRRLPLPPSSTVAYTTSPEALFERQASADGGTSTRGGVALLTPRNSENTPRGRDISDVRVYPDSIAGVFIVESWSGETESDSDDSSSASSTTTKVSRSIADFVWLENRLRLRYDGVIVPDLPAMALRGRLQHGFAYETERLRGLQRFLTMLISHPSLKHVDETAAFLTSSGTAWTIARAKKLIKPNRALTIDDSDNAVRAWMSFRFWQAGRRLNRAVGWFLNRDIADAQHELSPEEKALERLQRYVTSLEAALEKTRVAALNAANADELCSSRYAQVRQALATLGMQEGGVFRDVLHTPPLTLQHDDDDTTKRLDDVLNEYARRAQAAQRLVALRCSEREAYEYAVENYAALRARWEASTSSVWDNTATPAADNEAADVDNTDLHTQLAAAADTLAKAQRAYQLVDRSTHDELRRLRTQMHDEVLDALRDVASQRAEAHAEMRDAWSRVVVRIDEELPPDV